MTTRDFPVGAELPLSLDPGAEAVAPRLAATVMLLRDAVGGLEVFMLRRVAGMAFAPSMHVFPGGGVDPRDSSDDLPWSGPTPGEWADRLGCDEDAARGILAATAREVFEETGVLLAAPADGGETDVLERIGDEAGLARTRAALVARDFPFVDVLRDARLRLRTDLLTYRAHWITPMAEPRRYDTHFFLAEVPGGQEPDGATSEADASGWVRPRDVLDAWTAGEVQLLPPTIVCLEQLDAAGSVAQALAQDLPVWPIMPVLVDTPTGPAMRVDLP